MNKEKLARIMHDEYEKQAKIVRWKTQESCRVKFDDLPEANRIIMFIVAGIVLDKIFEEENLNERFKMKYKGKAGCINLDKM